ncbi:N-acetylmuramoyl-L-alanine amidase [uncultured Campylobacter sp.]|uniref:N-acetylmuramoyl-L-alanine amidase family protein n=1 Tax=uncultured Campylobacter sp. TaxID=218934 RepID=UPI00260E1ECD|nr:N-acetylmuramoyl-L-alanine amidase [uncultured Campylobacter sp.]
MGKIAKLLLPFFLAVFAFGGGVFDEFDNNFAKASKQDRIQIYHELKGVYLSSILNNNDKLKLECLERLVSGGKSLGIDYSVYANELDLLSSKFSKLKPKIVETKKSAQLAKNTTSKIVQKIEYKILSTSSSKDEFIIRLNENSSNIKIKKSQLNTNKSYRQIFDFDGVLTTSYKNKKSQISDQIRVAQFDKNSVRIVFTNDTKQEINYTIDGKNIIFSIKNSAQKATTKTKSAKTNQQSTQKTKTNEQKQSLKTTSAKSDIKNDTQKNISKTTAQKAQARGANKNRVIVLDAGHGGKDAGAVGKNKLYEKNIVLSIALETGKILKSRGYKVYFTRSNDKFINLRDRTSIANEKKADIFISIHANAAPNAKKAKEMQGIETYFLSPTRSERSMQVASLENKADTDEMNYFTKISYLNFLNREKIIASNKLAIDVQANLLGAVKSKFKVVDGGVREAPFWVLVGAQMPAVLIEAGYISNDKDHKLLSNKAYRDKIALGIANGIDDYFVKNR